MEEQHYIYCLLTGWFSLSFYFFSPSHLNPLCICSWNISGSQGQAHSFTHSCAIPDNHSSPPSPIWLPKRPEQRGKLSRRSGQCSVVNGRPTRPVNKTLSPDSAENNHKWCNLNGVDIYIYMYVCVYIWLLFHSVLCMQVILRCFTSVGS